jgi:hypothetical protein
MSDLRMQRSVLWFIIAMGDTCAAFGIGRSAWWAILFGLIMMAGGAWWLRRVYREIKIQKEMLPSMMEDVAFRHELWRHNGRTDLAWEALLLKRGTGLYR